MEVQFYYSTSDDRKINKVLTDGPLIVGTPLDNVSIEAPVIRFESTELMLWNYAWIEELQRYYRITARDIYREGIYDITFEVDPLMSFRGDIQEYYVVVDKQSMESNGDEYIDDGSLVTDNLMFSEVVNFPEGFNENPEYILITAG